MAAMDIEKTIEFILNQQAEFVVGMQQLREEANNSVKQTRNCVKPSPGW